ncbi:unnamed protein product [Ixodes pacificus]
MESTAENDTPDVVKGLTAIDTSPQVMYPTLDTLATSKALRIMPMNDQIKELQTIIRDKNTSRSEFVFYADRLVSIISTIPFSSRIKTEALLFCHYTVLTRPRNIRLRLREPLPELGSYSPVALFFRYAWL